MTETQATSKDNTTPKPTQRTNWIAKTLVINALPSIVDGEMVEWSKTLC